MGLDLVMQIGMQLNLGQDQGQSSGPEHGAWNPVCLIIAVKYINRL